MDFDEKLLKKISNKTKDSIVNLDVVTPTIYKTVFSKFASSYHVDLENEEEVSENVLDAKLSVLLNFQGHTTQAVDKLDTNTKEAIKAIKEKNETILQEVLKKTQSLKQEIKELKRTIYKDELTKTYNRKWLHDNILDDNAQGFINSGILCIIDLNYFKDINDTYGHIVGDKVLIFVANELKKLKANIVRYGGDEFVIIFDDTKTQELIRKKLEKIREDILKKQMKLKDSSFKVSFAFGVQKFLKGDTLVKIVDYADKNMYNDKIKIKQRIKGI